MEEKLYTPLEAAELLKVKKNTIYDMIKRKQLNAVKMGKQFRILESDLTAIIHPSSQPQTSPTTDPPYYEQKITLTSNSATKKTLTPIIVCGQDIVIDMLCSAVTLALGQSNFVRSYQGSYNGLYAMYKEEVTVATAHLWDRATDTYNIPFLSALLPGEDVRLYHVLRRPVGIYVKKGNPKNIQSILDLQRNDVTMANREKGSGIRILTDSLLRKEKLTPSSILGYSREVNTHLAAAALVSKGGADCAFGVKNVASQFPDIDFIFIKEEQYDLCIRERDIHNPSIQKMIELLQSSDFKEQVNTLGIYDCTKMGKRLH